MVTVSPASKGKEVLALLFLLAPILMLKDPVARMIETSDEVASGEVDGSMALAFVLRLQSTLKQIKTPQIALRILPTNREIIRIGTGVAPVVLLHAADRGG